MVCQKGTKQGSTPSPRRTWQCGGVLIAGALLALGCYSVFVEPNRLVVHEASLVMPEWTGPTMRIVAVSDLHLGAPFMTPEKIRTVVDLIRAEQPNLLVLLGDYVAHGEPGAVDAWKTAAAEFKRVYPRYGKYAVLGDHDCQDNTNAIMAALEDAGVTVLDNNVTAVRGEPFYLWGLGDLGEEPVDYRGPLQLVPPGAPVIALSHTPDVFPHISQRVALTLAGHTHGGQLRLLWRRALASSEYGQRFAAGHIVEQGRHLFVTTGLGTSGLPARLGVPPEIAVLDIRGMPPR